MWIKNKMEESRLFPVYQDGEVRQKGRVSVVLSLQPENNI